MKETDNKRKKNVPKKVYIITADKEKSKKNIAKAMAQIYRRMKNPV